VPFPIQSASITDRLRKFFRIRGKTSFSLDEVVAPVVLVQDLTKGPYQAGVTPAAGVVREFVGAAGSFSFAFLLNDKPGSLTPVLDRQFDDRTFSFTWAEIANVEIAAPGPLPDLALRLASRADVLASGVPTAAASLVSIQENDGSIKIPVEIFVFDAALIPGVDIWRGQLGDNTNTLGVRRTFPDVQPNITIGPKDALLFVSLTGAAPGVEVAVSARGFYQEQPA